MIVEQLATSEDVATSVSREPSSAAEWHRALWSGLGAFIVTRLLVVGGTYGVAILNSMTRQTHGQRVAGSTRRLIEGHLTQWDGRWYEIIARDGYQSELPERIGYRFDDSGAAIAFFPGYPVLARWFDHVMPGGIDHAMLGLNIVLGVTGMVLVGLLARNQYGADTARRAMVLYSVFPGSFVMSWSYSEPLLVVCAAGCLLALTKQRWWIAGLLAALASATRPNGLALAAACAVAAGIAIWRRREWRSLAAVIPAPLGFVGFMWYLRVHTGEASPWMRSQRDAWGEAYSWGATPIRYMWRFGENPLATGFGPLYLHTTLAVVLFAFGCYCAIRARIPVVWLVYALGIGFFMLTPLIVSARPRFVWTAFPLAIAVAAWWPQSWRARWDLLVMSSASSLVCFSVLYAGWAMIP